MAVTMGHMLLPRSLRPSFLGLFRSRRAFSTSRASLQLQLAQQAWPDKPSANAAESKCNPIIFMHGLFGSKQNNRSMSKVLASQLNISVYAIDLRNHGDSPHDPEHNYTAMADDVEGLIQNSKLQKPVLIGHSMGAKTAMTLALRSPDLVSAIVSVDNAPINAPLSNDFAKYIRGMKEIEGANVTKQREADEILQPYEPSLPIRQFLLTNLVRSKDDNTLKFRIPLDILNDALDNMADFPFAQELNGPRFDGASLFIRGTRSRYVKDESLKVVKAFFPAFELEDIDAGHWLISENPEAFKNAVVRFLSKS